MCTLYLQFCKDNHIDETFIAKRWVCFDVFDKHFQLSFKPPDVDACDLCDSFQARLKCNALGQADKNILIAEYESHLIESKRMCNLKSEDIKASKTTPTHKVLRTDLQKGLPTLLLTNGISFYKRKLWILNYTLFDSSDKSVHCMMWDESKAGHGGARKWSSDDCYGQNKNIVIIMCFFWIMNKYPQIKCVNLKYLLKGHTHMDADTIRALIERKRKKMNNMTILTPWDWQQMLIICTAWDKKIFKRFTSLFSGRSAQFIYRKTSVEKEKVLRSSCVHIQVQQENIAMLYMKSSFDSEFDTVDLNRLKRKSGRFEEEKFPKILPVKFPVPISEQKSYDLISLLPYVPSVCHAFYKNLQKSSVNNRNYPESADNDSLEH
ncbi:hypothetical protein PR048_031550 [Dryococelus australis]|uniref:DUF7869 domain-containing protein n=1 Tax=Dryococelus australis TaxID=614101 RepID=A0ABQ9G8E5_9NEOP|nr:hypothetical protein PR048_031550 [Dryococelus australis]